MEARWSKCAVRVCTGQIEQELSEVTQGLADIPRHYTESELDALDIEMSSQPGRNSPGSSIAEGVSSIAETISADARSIPGHMGARFAQSDAGFPYSDPIDARVPTSLSDPGMFFSYSETDSIPAETEPFEEGSMVESMVEDLRGLVFASSDDDLEEEL